MRAARADGRSQSNSAHHGVMTETKRHSLHRCKPSYDDGGDGSSGSIFGKGRSVRALRAAFNTKAAAVAVTDNRDPLFIRDRRSGMRSIIIARIASAADTDSATPWTFFIGSHCYHLAPGPRSDRALVASPTPDS
jgi:hypothetical protein